MTTPIDPDAIHKQKVQLREKMIQARLAVDAEKSIQLAEKAWAHLKDLDAFQKAGTVAAFMAARGEIETGPLLQGILQTGKRLALPRVEKGRMPLSFYRIQSPKDLVPGSFGILEPKPDEPVDPSELDLVLVPGVAFDRKGHRLGFGKGFYDHTLPLLKPGTLTLGFCYSFQITTEVPTIPTDAPVRALLSESGYELCQP